MISKYMLPAVAILVLIAETRALTLESESSGNPFRRNRIPVGEHEARPLAAFPAPRNCGMNLNSKKRESAVCGGIQRYPPTLVSNSKDKVSEYSNVVCNTHDGWETPQEDMTVTMTEVSGGEVCAYTPSSKVGYSMHREVWNNSHTMLLGDWANKEFMTSNNRKKASENKRMKKDLDEDLMIVPYAHFHGIYAHSLLDFLPQAYATVDYVKARGLKILTGSNLQKRLLLATGLDRDFISSAMAVEDQLVCLRKGRSIHVMETNMADKTAHEYYYHRMIGYRGVGQRIAAAMVAADTSGRLRGTSRLPTVVFLGRCGAAARAMDNEDNAFKMVEQTMEKKGRPEQLVRFCGDAGQPEVQAAALSRATAVVGPHGGAMANLLYVNPGCNTHIIEFVQSAPFVPPGAGQAPQGRYKSFYYYGIGAPLDYKLVLMDKVSGKNNTESLHVRLGDLKMALDRIWPA